MTPAELVAIAYRLGADRSGEAEESIDEWIRGAAPAQIVELAAAARTSFRYGVWSDYVDLNAPIASSRMRQAAPHRPTTVAALLSTHRSGYVRELGLSQLVNAPDELVVPFLLLRADDIVPGIRKMAEDAVLSRLHRDLALTFARSLRIVELLRGRARGGSGNLVHLIHAFLAQPDGRDALVTTMTDADPVVRRLALGLRLRTEGAASVLTQALGDRDTRVRLWAARTVMSRATNDEEKRALLPLLEASRSAWVRTLALRGRWHLDPSDAAIEAALLDHHTAVRYLARTLLRAKKPSRAFGAARARALAVLSKPDASVGDHIGALGALADVGLAADVDVALRFVDDPRPRVRAEASRTVKLLAPSSGR
jgi:hypothetical protein